mgnify:FL=1
MRYSGQGGVAFKGFPLGVLSGCRLTRASELILLSRITKDLEGFIENEVSYGIGRCGFVALVAFLIWVLRK